MIPDVPYPNATNIRGAPGAQLAPLASELVKEDESEVLEFLAQRPLHTAIMTGLIRDNGLESELNRGRFYGLRDVAGNLDGVALIGHAVYLEARTHAALREFARLAQSVPRLRIILAEESITKRFWDYYACGEPANNCRREVLFEAREGASEIAAAPQIRLASLHELRAVTVIHAALAFAESGVNPLETDRAGFRRRCQRRIEQGRVWVWIEGAELIFKADVISEAPEVTYIEGVYVAPAHRGKGHGRRCLAQLSRELLKRTNSVTALVDEQHHQSKDLFCRVGFKPRANYQTIFLQGTKAGRSQSVRC